MPPSSKRIGYTRTLNRHVECDPHQGRPVMLPKVSMLFASVSTGRVVSHGRLASVWSRNHQRYSGGVKEATLQAIGSDADVLRFDDWSTEFDHHGTDGADVHVHPSLPVPFHRH